MDIRKKLDEIFDYIKKSNNPKGYMDIKALSKFCSLSPSTIHRAIDRKELKVNKSTGKLLFKYEDVDSWLDA